MNQAWLGRPKDVYRWIQNEYQPPLVMLLDPETQQPTSNVNRMDDILHASWDKVMRKYAHAPEPDTEFFCSAVGSCKPPLSQAPDSSRGSGKWAPIQPPALTAGASLICYHCQYS